MAFYSIIVKNVRAFGQKVFKVQQYRLAAGAVFRIVRSLDKDRSTILQCSLLSCARVADGEQLVIGLESQQAGS